jgi:uncharacterized SAM-binding protein YcdF (DUF218 family)
MVDILKSYFQLTQPLWLVIVLGALAAWMYLRPASRAGRRGLLLFVVLYYVLSTPFGAGALTALASYGLSPIATPAQARGADTIVLLGGGSSTYMLNGVVLTSLADESILRALEAVRVYHLLGKATIISSGGLVHPDERKVPEATIMHRALVEAGIPDAEIIDESQSATTRDQAVRVGSILRARGTSRFVLVTSPSHMWRSLYAFRAVGLDPIPSVAPVRSETGRRPPLFLPNGGSLALSDLAIYDTVALVYYWWEGWT